MTHREQFIAEVGRQARVKPEVVQGRNPDAVAMWAGHRFVSASDREMRLNVHRMPRLVADRLRCSEHFKVKRKS